MKISLIDRRIFRSFLQISSGVSAALSTFLLFVEIPSYYKFLSLLAFVAILILIYLFIWIKANVMKSIDLNIDGTFVSIKAGDIFLQPGLKVISFNEYFDTIVDDKIISKASLNGKFLNDYLDVSISEFDKKIEDFHYEEDEILEYNKNRKSGKKQKYRLGTIFTYEEFIITAMSKFDNSNKATLTMPEFLDFLIQFWDRVNKVYAQKSVSAPIFGSGITRIKGHKNISDEDLLKIMLWTFRISEMRFKHPAKLSIIVHAEKIDQINLLDIKLLSNGL